MNNSNYGPNVGAILKSWADEAEVKGDNHLEFNVFGLTDISVNAHELNVYLASMRRPGGFQNIELFKNIAITCARIVNDYANVEKETKQEEVSVQKPTKGRTKNNSNENNS